MGVFGAVLATLIARAVACIVILKMLSHRDNDVCVNDYLHWKFDFMYIKKILAIGIPSGLENGMFQLGKILVQSLIATFGTYSIAANAVSNKLGSNADYSWDGNVFGDGDGCRSMCRCK